ncbi:phage major tail protein, TP901-1 family [Mammaliicoccus sciuri]|uniref:phage major tail protein, TP901-1 family n=1 Tax=Mammaliicoccus sciuri TaxID=1296 RepID=UPI00379DB664
MKKANSNDALLLFRECYQKVDANKLMLATEYGVSHERDSDTESTMDGSYSTGGSLESVLSYTAKMAQKDQFSEEVEDDVLDGVRYEAWDINSMYEGTGENVGKYRARYFQGYFKKFEKSGEADGVDEYETEFAVDGRMQRGWATIPRSIANAVKNSSYKFHDTLKSDPAIEQITDDVDNVVSPEAESSDDPEEV